MQITTSRARVRAVLGPTNTGKTHLAMERMLGHASGIIGFPLRLLARENYERAVAVKGKGRVALITGEEKIVPAGARYFVCTVESMPVKRHAAFLAVDEIQMCADAERGHVFTDRLLRARGEEETMFLGAATIRHRLRQLVPDIEFMERPRLSTLAYAGSRKITRLPPRSAVVAFSAAEVYAIAELMRRQRGGAAVVMGALSPRTRNAQVAMYQAGEVDYLVATDAIGMGLNLQLDHVAFAEKRKFDGRAPRDLTAAELAQVAGRAGRHMNDGTFGTTGEVEPFDPEIVARIENHDFEPLRTLMWRNSDLDFASIEALLASLAAPPPAPGLARAGDADDARLLAALAREPDIARLAGGADAVALLWEVCRVPDFHKGMSEAHFHLLGRVYRYLMGPAATLPTDWVAENVARVESTDGDIETLVQRIANVRTWTYVSFHSDWVEDAAHWQERTRDVEDRLSDALHARLTQRFVDRRTARLVRRRGEREALAVAVGSEGEVHVEDHFVGALEGFRFIPDVTGPDGSGRGSAARTVINAAERALTGEIAGRLRCLEADGDDAFALAPHGVLCWRGAEVGRLAPGRGVLEPRVEPAASGLLAPEQRQRLCRRLTSWLEDAIGARLGPLVEARRASLAGPARGIVFQLGEGLGSVPRRRVESQIAALGRTERKALREFGIRLGRHTVFMPALVKPAAVDMRALLWAAHAGIAAVPPPPGRVSLPTEDGMPREFYEAAGYRVLGPLALRVDMVERLAARAWALSRGGPFAAGPELLSLAGCGSGEMAEVLAALGYRGTGPDDAMTPGNAVTYVRAPRRKARAERSGAAAARHKADSPFAKLRDLAVPR
ncbi:MAG: helicase-related protein [Rhodospirillales bacterium]|jgi:ATP-dependent RNA helicase SUPV3L1/SUV3|nr:helicase-related protein [Rhodospirillales bacterium]